jgi:PKD repeat protein
MPGTQPEDNIVPLDAVAVCADCHGNYDQNAEPLHNWRGSMMAHAGRDPIFWATLAIAEQGFDGAGDLCIRCHNAAGWLDGRSAPTDGSQLDELADRDGVQCDLCHRMTNPDDSEHLGEQTDPFVANDGGNPVEGNYGSGQYVVALSNATKLGPYADATPPPAAHNALQSDFHRSPELCGTCHDVSNPVTGDLAHNNGAQVDLNYNGGFDSPLDAKVAFNYRPYQYGVVERTYSEHKASRLATTLVSDYPNLPADLQAGAIQRAYEAATAATPDGNYSDGTPRYFTCQTCHMPPVQGRGAGFPAGGPFAPQVRSDMPKHDLTGGNYWMPEAMQWLDARGRLRFGGLTAAEISAMNDGANRARSNLEAAASLSVTGNTVKVVNLTSHKLISGYPEGRRMWLNIQWFDIDGNLIREDGAYGDLQTELDLDGDGAPDSVRTLLDLHDQNTRIYEVHGAITQEWASQLVALNAQKYADMPVTFDRVNGQVTATMTDVASLPVGKAEHSFHFVLNNYVKSDTRIPGYGMSYDEARKRNALPVPETQYGNPGPGGEFNYWDELALNVPAGAETATIRLLYQPTSWEYVSFLYLANESPTPNLSGTGQDFLDAWFNTGMAEPHVMATTTWVNTGEALTNASPTAEFSSLCTDLTCSFDASASFDSDGNIVTYAWDFGDGSTATGVSANHAFAVDGTYIVTLTVTDDGGASATVSQSLTVTAGTNPVPIADFSFVCNDLTCDFDGSLSTDDGSITSYTWDFGDGASASGVTSTHTYGAEGTYSVTLTVTDDGGAIASVSQTVSVTAPLVNQAPVADFSFACTDLTCDFDGSLSSDDGTLVSYAWDFGDGATAAGVTSTYTYGAEGTYSVTLTVTDDQGLTGSAMQNVTVTAPVATTTIPGPGPGPRRGR